MFIKQVSVFVENETGRLSDYTKILKDNNIDMKAVCIAHTVDFGILRCIVDDPDKAVNVLNENGFTASITTVIAVSFENVPGALHSVLEKLADEGIGVDYIYSMIRSETGKATLIFKVGDPEKAGKVLMENHISLLCMKDI
jgi:hypothetical protein